MWPGLFKESINYYIMFQGNNLIKICHKWILSQQVLLVVWTPPYCAAMPDVINDCLDTGWLCGLHVIRD